MRIKDDKELTYVKGHVLEISDISLVECSNGDMRKTATMTIQTQDGQILFLDIRGSKSFTRLQRLNINTDDYVEVGFIFVGVKSFSKSFNNLHVRYIQLA